MVVLLTAVEEQGVVVMVMVVVEAEAKATYQDQLLVQAKHHLLQLTSPPLLLHPHAAPHALTHLEFLLFILL